MSIEFETALAHPLPPAAVAAVVAAVAARGPFRLHAVDGHEYQFVLTTATGGAYHVSLHVSDASLYVAFHAASRSDRQAFLDAATAALREHGVEAEFEEL